MSPYLKYFQLSALAIAFITFVGRLIYLIIFKKINPIVIGVGKDWNQRAIEFSIFIIFIFWSITVLFNLFGTNNPIFNTYLFKKLFDFSLFKIIGSLFIVIGILIFYSALLSFKFSWRLGIDDRKPGDLITKGIFSFTRNPIYVFLDLLVAGIFLLNGRVIFLILSIVIIICLHIQILSEEKFLRLYYKDEYKEYCSRTGRYFSVRKKIMD